MLNDNRQIFEYQALLTVLIELIEARAGVQIQRNDEWKNGAQVLGVKLLRHLLSMKFIASGSLLKHRSLSVPFIDHASVNVIARAAFETYLVFFYIYGGEDEELTKFRFKVWNLGGLAERQKTYAYSEHARQKLSEEKEQIENLRREISASPFMQAYRVKQQASLLRGEWRIGNAWHELSAQAGFHERYFKDLYNYLCAYSHSSYLSALQVSQARSLADQNMLTRATIGVGCVLMAHFALSFSRLVSSANEIFAFNPAGKRAADKWWLTSENMSFLYKPADDLAAAQPSP